MTMDSSSRSRRTSRSSEAAARGAGEGLCRRAFAAALARDAAALALAGLGPALLPGCTVPVRSFRAPPGGAIEVPLERFPELETPGGMVKVLTPGSGPIYVRRGAGEAFEGISAVCTHQRCTVAPDGGGFRCPCHGSTYDAEGRNTGGPARRPLARFPAERRGGVVVLRLEGGSA